jgi:hypothetical protein
MVLQYILMWPHYPVSENLRQQETKSNG